MELVVYWTDFAKSELKSIFNFYKKNVSLTFAKKFVLNITKEANNLQKHPEIGQIEELLSNKNREFRYFIYENHKIIYWINRKKSQIEIFDVFDTRQNPITIKRNK